MGYKVRFVGFPQQYEALKGELNAEFESVMSRGQFIMREEMEEFEESIAKYVGVKHALSVNSGTDALYLSAIAAGLGQGDEAITVSHTFAATIGAIANQGATPVLVDIADDYNMDVDLLEKAITSKTKVILPVHLNGHMCEMDRIMELAEEKNLVVIEDAAQALGAEFNGKKAASYGLSGIFSFYPAKMLGAAGDGGIVTTNDDEFAKKIRALRDNGRIDDVKVINCYGYCSRLDNLQAALLNVKLKHFPQWVEKRREIAKKYDDELAGLEGITPHPRADDRFFDVYQNYVIRSTKRDELHEFLKADGVETMVSWWVPTHKQEALGLGHFDLPKTEQISREVLSLPMFPEMTDEEVDYVIGAVKKFKA
ncbi:DegT/DnrJ/EryC1/StrS family aminotransferase [archaeon]